MNRGRLCVLAVGVAAMLPWKQTITRIIDIISDHVLLYVNQNGLLYAADSEDPRLDSAILNITPDDSICMLASAGDNALDFLLQRPKQIVAVDQSLGQTALLDLKIAMIRTASPDVLMGVFGENQTGLPPAVFEKASHLMKEESVRWWKEGSRLDTFKDWHRRGSMEAWGWSIFMNLTWYGCADLYDRLASPACPPLQEQRSLYLTTCRPFWESIMNAFPNLLGHVVLMATGSTSDQVANDKACMQILDGLFYNSSICDNYFHHVLWRGGYSHYSKPRWLDEANLKSLRQLLPRLIVAPHASIEKTIQTYPPDHFTILYLRDSIDWYSPGALFSTWKLFQELAPNARVLWRRVPAGKSPPAAIRHLVEHDTGHVEQSIATFGDRHEGQYSVFLSRFVPAKGDATPFLPPVSWLKLRKAQLQMHLHGFQSSSVNDSGLDKYYDEQAELYDQTRAFLHVGTEALVNRIPAGVCNGVLVDLGSGTGMVLEFLGARLARFGKVFAVEASNAMRKLLSKRVQRRGWTNVKVLAVSINGLLDESGARTFSDDSVDVVTMSYSLVLLPRWRDALAETQRMLRPGGYVATVDHTIFEDQSSTMQWFWAGFFHAELHLDKDMLPTLKSAFTTVFERSSYLYGWPYLEWLPSPYFIFVGKTAST